MSKVDIELKCFKKAEELIKKYFPDFIKDAAIIRPEALTEEYNNDLPNKVALEFRCWLAELWKDVTNNKEQRSFDEIMNLARSIEITNSSYVPYLNDARKEAENITLWEKLTKTNHEDVTYYKGMLKQYIEELLNVMIKDFVADIPD